jgi:hypothetical protein
VLPVETWYEFLVFPSGSQLNGSGGVPNWSVMKLQLQAANPTQRNANIAATKTQL